MEKKNNFMLVMIVILSVSLLGAVSFIVYDKVIKKDEGTNTATKPINNNEQSNDSSDTTDKTNNNQNEQANTTTYDKINYQLLNDNDGNKDAKLTINDKVVIDNAATGLTVNQYMDLLFVDSYGDAWQGLTIFDKYGKTVGSIAFGENSSLGVKGKSVDWEYKMSTDGNNITIGTTNMTSDNEFGICKLIEEYKSKNEPAKYVTKLTYLGNGKFSNPVIVETISASEYEDKMNLDCSKCASLKSSGELNKDNNCRK